MLEISGDNKLWMLKNVLLGAACLLAVSSSFAESCKVLDPEIAAEYAGDCRNGLADGYGIAKGESHYQGEFKNGMKHGRGIKVWAIGDRYEGEFRNDRREGWGRYHWGDQSQWPGDRYSGQYHNDKPEGQGIYEWSSGDRFEGMWKEGLRYGPSAMEIQQNRARLALTEAVGRPGVVVCQVSSQGINLNETVRGKVERVVGERLEVRVMGPGGTFLDGDDGLNQKSRIINSEMINWYPCY